MFYYNAFLVLILALLVANLLWNLAALKRIARTEKPSKFPWVSVLIPARNEERRIGRLLESLSRQTYPSYEVLVLDDQSEDRTVEIVEEAMRHDGRIRLLRGKPLPRGWQGKCFACHQLAREAQGELLLFTDADTFHAPESLAASVAALETARADLLTIFTQLELGSFWEKIFLPLLPFTMLAYVPLAHGVRRWVPKFTLGNGQFLLFRRSVYQATGGHEAVRDAMVDDVWIARQVQASGYRVMIQDGSEIVSVRMYQGLREIWEGFSKNFFAGLEYSFPLLGIATLGLGAVYLVPYLILISGLVLKKGVVSWILLPLGQILIVWLMRLLVSIRWGFEFRWVLAHPLAVGLSLLIALNSAYRTTSGRGVQWKGRSYLFRRPVSSDSARPVPPPQ